MAEYEEEKILKFLLIFGTNCILKTILACISIVKFKSNIRLENISVRLIIELYEVSEWSKWSDGSKW